ncbi:hypothetical protein ACH5AO_23615 [Streptomyces sp. NPDC018964]|uniref:hypothetical protein n=1 Tax=Streptomyces sp. NPDC018964 TaxID=3365058 RepID=UPI0037B398E0
MDDVTARPDTGGPSLTASSSSRTRNRPPGPPPAPRIHRRTPPTSEPPTAGSTHPTAPPTAPETAACRRYSFSRRVRNPFAPASINENFSIATPNTVSAATNAPARDATHTHNRAKMFCINNRYNACNRNNCNNAPNGFSHASAITAAISTTRRNACHLIDAFVFSTCTAYSRANDANSPAPATRARTYSKPSPPENARITPRNRSPHSPSTAPDTPRPANPANRSNSSNTPTSTSCGTTTSSTTRRPFACAGRTPNTTSRNVANFGSTTITSLRHG